LFPEQHYGFIDTTDGREIYFHAHSVLGAAFARLAVDTSVEFVEEPGEEGPRATTVRMLE
jgi:cold shock CspA family protein